MLQLCVTSCFYLLIMKKLRIYLKGAMIGMIAEYCFRVEFGYLQGFLLITLVIGLILDVVNYWRE